MTYSKLDNNVVISSHPIPYEVRVSLNKRFPPITSYIEINSLRQKGLISAISSIRKIRANNLLVFVDDLEQTPYLDILLVLSFLVPSSQRLLIFSNAPPNYISVSVFLKSLLSLIVSIFSALNHLLLSYIEIYSLTRRLKKTTHISFKNKTNIIYLNTNQMVGVKAGGSIGHITGVINAFNKVDWEVIYVGTHDLEQLEHGVVFKRLKTKPLPPVFSDAARFGFGHAAASQVSQLLNDSSGTFIYQRMSRCDFSGVKLKFKHGVPLVLEYNGSEAWGSRHWGVKMCFEGLALKAEGLSIRAADLVVTVSDVLADELLKKGVDKSRIVVYPNCVDSNKFDPNRHKEKEKANLRKDYGINAGDFVFGFIGTFGFWHGIDFLCGAIRELVDTQREWLDSKNIKFLLVGDGHFGHSVKMLIDDPNIAKYVVWTGIVEQEQAPKFLAMMDVFLSPHVQNPDGSKFFGSPTKLFEFMSMRRPIIASNLEQIGLVLSPSIHASELDQFQDRCMLNKNAILFKPESRDEFLRALIFIEANRHVGEYIAKNARKKVLKKYRWSHHVNSIINKIKEYSF
ncbi:glycosyltransferase [Alphaproteobacteria bacterium]|nr:glycosyltransferase [Alphaproteobacteria bacterium]